MLFTEANRPVPRRRADTPIAGRHRRGARFGARARVRRVVWPASGRSAGSRRTAPCGVDWADGTGRRPVDAVIWCNRLPPRDRPASRRFASSMRRAGVAHDGTRARLRCQGLVAGGATAAWTGFALRRPPCSASQQRAVPRRRDIRRLGLPCRPRRAHAGQAWRGWRPAADRSGWTRREPPGEARPFAVRAREGAGRCFRRAPVRPYALRQGRPPRPPARAQGGSGSAGDGQGLCGRSVASGGDRDGGFRDAPVARPAAGTQRGVRLAGLRAGR